MEELNKQDQDFVKEVAITGNRTQAVKNAYGIENDGYARVKGSKLLTKDNIKTAVGEVKKSLADRVSIDKLEEVLNDGLNAYTGSGDDVKPDFGVRHKYLDTALKIKGEYQTDEEKKSINILMPVLVKFLDKKDDTTSNDRDTDRIPETL